MPPAIGIGRAARAGRMLKLVLAPAGTLARIAGPGLLTDRTAGPSPP